MKKGDNLVSYPWYANKEFLVPPHELLGSDTVIDFDEKRGN